MDDDRAQAIVKMFWGRTDRKQKSYSEKEIRPDEFHNWGEMTMIKDRSPTLSKIIKNGGISYISNFVDAFKTIMTELDLHYEVIPMKTFKPNEKDTHAQKKAVVYEVHSTPRWTFRGLGSSDEDANIKAAKSGVEFLIVMAS